MIGKNKKRIEITLSNEDNQMLESLSSRFNITKSEVIRQAIKIFASKHRHVYKVYIQESKLEENNQVNNQPEDWDTIINGD